MNNLIAILTLVGQLAYDVEQVIGAFQSTLDPSHPAQTPLKNLVQTFQQINSGATTAAKSLQAP